MNAQELASGRPGHELFEERASGCHEMAPKLFEEIGTATSASVVLSEEPLLCGGQRAAEVDDQFVIDKMRGDVPRPPAQIVLLKPCDSTAHGGLNFSLRSHGSPPLDSPLWRGLDGSGFGVGTKRATRFPKGPAQAPCLAQTPNYNLGDW